MLNFEVSFRPFRANVATMVALLTVAFGSGFEAAVFAEDCARQVVALERDGVGSTPVEDQEKWGELGEDIRYCTYTLGTEALEQALGSCIVMSVTFNGLAPAPRMLTLIKGWDEIAGQVDVSSSKDGKGWTWAGDGLGCQEAHCLDGEIVSVHVMGNEFGLSDGVENCPWERLDAVFQLGNEP